MAEGEVAVRHSAVLVAVALDQATIDAIASELAQQGFTKMEVKIGPNGAKVEAYGPPSWDRTP